jgi:excisionase family DNA binding protein
MKPDAKQAKKEIERLLRPEEVAAILGVPVTTLYRWRYHRTGPVALRVGKHLRYRAEDVQSYISAKAAESSVEPGLVVPTPSDPAT